MSELYPLKFKPIPREMVWGGDKLRRLFGKDFPAGSKIGESWEISSIRDKVSEVCNGFLKGNNLQELIEVYMGDLVGEDVFDRYGTVFPLLIKLIDATDDLSIQVHPGDELAALRHDSPGKTEMWYVLEAEPGAEIITGFNQEVTPEIFIEKLNGGKILDILNVEKVKAGDAFFIPAGRVHAIKAGIVLAEIQQSSDITYRIYDWDRLDSDGNSRELHLDEAIDAIDYRFYDEYSTIAGEEPDLPVLLADCEYFTTNIVNFDKDISRDYNMVDSFVIYLCIKGEFRLDWGKGTMEVQKGDTIIIPAVIERVTMSTGSPSSFLEVFIK
jgi:mannose-6-phosphate isomerase